MEDIAAASGITKLVVYRHFESKAELYRRVLERVHERMRDVFLTRLSEGVPGRTAVEAMLTAAREDPDGFRLLWRHSAREAEFAAYADEVRSLSLEAARRLIQPRLADAALLEWAAHTSVAFLVEATLAWLDHGDPGRDDHYVALTSQSLANAVSAWLR